MATEKIYLTLDGSTLKWSADGSTNWQDVTPTIPDTGVNAGDEIDWIADDTISKVKIKIKNQSKIIKQIKNNDSKKPIGDVYTNIADPVTEKYEISAKPASGGGGYITVDPQIKYPA